MVEGEPIDREQVIWQAYPAWSQFTWLYLFAALAAARGALFVKFEVPGYEMWFLGAGILVACAAVVRRWARYVITPGKVAIINGYTNRETEAIPHRDVTSVSVRQGPIAGLFGIGTVYIHAADGERFIRFRGIQDAEVVRKRIEALRPADATP